MEKERGKRGAESLPRKRAGSPAPSCVSMKSDKSMGLPPKFSMEPFPPDQSLPRKRAGSPAPSCVSMKSDKSMGLPPKFSEEPFPPDQRDQVERCNSDPHEGDLSSVFKFPEEKAQMLLNDDPADRLEQRHLLSQCQRRMKCDLKKKCECVFEGKAKEGQPTLLSEIYTELYITEGGTGEVNDEHEVRQIETASKKRVTEDTTVKCNDIFKPLCGRETPIRTVLTKGVAGIGKTVSVQKFILDWAEGKANQDVHFIFALPFRNLNLIKDEYSLIELLHHFVPELKSFEPSELFMYKVLFIFDGLDECRLPLDFQNNESWFDVTKRMSLDVLLTNLIKGNLLPSALLWITSRPAAANQIPAKCVHQVTEIRGFSDAQKEEYFRRRFNDQSLASRIISHVKSSRSLFIMCHIPVFCWMSATVLERLFSETDSGEIPKTLTEMYTHFLIFQTTLKNVKYMKNHETKLNEYSKEFLLKLGKLAFDNLEKGNLIFYEQDLSENGIDVTETSVYSGVCTEVFKEEYGLYQEKVYCFVHLSIQEYLAALYVFLSNTSPDLLETAVDQALESKNGHLDLYLRFLLGLSTDSSQNLLQWLLGQTRINSRNVEEMHRYMHPSSFCTPRSALWEFEADFHRRMSRLFLSELGSNPKRDANPFLAQYIKHKIQENLSPERTINLFHCLNELGDNSLVEEVQRYLNSGRLSAEGLSPAQYSALAFVLLMSDEELDVFDMKKFVRSDKEHWRLLPVVKTSKTALLNGCNLTEKCCEALASALRSNSSALRELDLSDNDLSDHVLSDNDPNVYHQQILKLMLMFHRQIGKLGKNSGVKLLSAGLGDSHCKLEILRLSGCRVREEGCSSLASALRSNPSHLRELDLSYNHPGDSGVKLLSAVLEDPSCKLEKLNGLMERADSPVPSCVSMKSDQSMEPPRNLSDGPFPPDQSGLMERAGSPVPSCVSMKSDQSMEPPRNLSDGPFPPDQRDQVKRCNSDPHEGDLSSVFKFPEEKAHMFLNDDPADRLEQSKSPHLLSHCQHRIKHNLKKKCECVFEGKAKEGRPTLLSEIYTELYITEGGTGGVNDEHEVRQIETASKKRVTRDTTVKCNDIIKPLCGRETPIRTVLTKGVAGIGKTVSVQKFILDWAEGKANQDVHFIFALPFRNLNLIKDEYSLIELLHHFVPELKSFEPSELFMYKVLFIFDGLDECRLPLDFQNNESWFDVTKKMSLDVLLTNLIKGNLLPSALLWITSRPAAASQIPAKCVHQVTEIRGFSDAQKEEYFRRRFNDQSLASRIISHVKSSRSLFIMCHIPVFCWMSATVLERLFSETDSGEIPKTLTEMYTHFLIFQTTLKNDKYMKNHETKLNEYSKKFLLKLGKLAFDNLEKGNLIFYEQDLTENDIDVTEASVYSGVCTEVFKEEYGLYQEKVYCFVHLSIQEYLAALYVFLSNTSPDLLETVVDEALESKNGHLDLYLRFLLGLSTDSNQNLLQRLLGQTRTSSHNLEETVKYIKENVQENLSTERTINLFHCLNELGDNSLVEEVQRFLNSERLSAEGLSPAQYSALAFVLLMSDEELDVFDLKKFVRSDKEHWRLLPVVKTSKTALLNSCDLTGECCEELASALRSNSSPLRELDLSDNDLSDHVLQDPGGKPHFARQRDFHRKLDKDSEEKLLSAGLGNSHCKQEILRLNGCDLTEKCCEALASGLRSNSSPLSDNDLSVNDQQDSGVKLLSAGLADSHCKLEILRLSGCRVREEGCSFLASALRSNPSHLRELDLSYNHPGDSGVKLLSAVLEDPSCKLEKLKLDRCELTEKCCEALASALRSNSSPLRELDLSDNDLQESGVKLLSAGLGDSHCKLEILRLSGCRVTEEGCSSLASALRSNPSHLRELDLSYNHPGDSGVKLLSAVLEDPSCKLEKLNVDQSGECRIRPGFLKYSCHLTLDPNTAHRCLSLSEGNRKVQWVEEEPYPDHPERFDRWKQVLCRESLTGRCYWEAEWWGADPRIGVTYKGIRRKGESDDCGLGFNEKSWILSRHNLPSIYFVQHNNKRTDLPRDTPIPPRVGVYLDWEAGTLCFYSVFSDGLTLLHRFTSTFTEPLCPGLAIGANRPGFEDHHPYGVLSLRTLE
ncbi:uncharacterized protein LOC125749639 isoform X24 [Brienomyrus brachyistius]|uniref:uncharacterized protein LOC125749639 isoform X24 n=1 Tax=Brienomyrus brachyistius TaxID=42636 RepID=UPI0020B1DB33|nr:uncharacterized protein LOC125749639 isoform X24 [Brienomyrus brachyistius]